MPLISCVLPPASPACTSAPDFLVIQAILSCLSHVETAADYLCVSVREVLLTHFGIQKTLHDSQELSLVRQLMVIVSSGYAC